MKALLVFLFIGLLIISACKKDKVIANKIISVCGTAGWPQVHAKVKFVVTGISKPDSANFNINGGQVRFGTFYNKTFVNPSLMLSDSVYFCGDKNSDVILNVYDHDTSKTYLTKIYINDTLIIQKTGYRQVFTVASCK